MVERVPTKMSALKKMVADGLEIESVIDVGVFTCTYELIQCFPDKKHVLFEPVPHFRSRIEKYYSDKGIDYDYFQYAVSSEIGEAHLKLIKNSEQNTTHSQLSETTGDDVVPVHKCTLDSVVLPGSYGHPFLLKVDVDGQDLEVIKGAQEVLKKTNCVIIESVVEKINATCNLLARHGMTLLEIVDLCYSHGILWQVDLVFVPAKFVSLYKKHPKLDKSDCTPWFSLNNTF